MPLLVSPDLTLYRVDDESALSALAKAVGPLFPRYENMRQLLGFAPGPGGESGKTRENWSLLEEVTWVEQSSSGIYMPLVGTALHKLSLFNAQLGTSHALTSSFRKLLTGERGFMGGWHKMKEAPAAACALESGTSLLRICSEGASPPAAHAAEQSQQVISAPPQQLQPQPLPQQSSSNPKLRTPLGKQSTGRDADSSAKRVRLGGLFSSNIFDALEDDEEQQLLAEEDLPEDLPERPEPLPPSESQPQPAPSQPAVYGASSWRRSMQTPSQPQSPSSAAVLGAMPAPLVQPAGLVQPPLQLPSSLEAGETVLWRQRAELAELKLGQLEAALSATEAAVSAGQREISRLAAGIAASVSASDVTSDITGMSDSASVAAASLIESDDAESQSSEGSDSSDEDEAGGEPETATATTAAPSSAADRWRQIFSKPVATAAAQEAARKARKAERLRGLPPEDRPTGSWDLQMFRSMGIYVVGYLSRLGEGWGGAGACVGSCLPLAWG